MGLELTDRIISEIVKSQIDFIKRHNTRSSVDIDYGALKKNLTAGLKEYSSRNNERNKEPDYKLLNKLEKEDHKQGVYTILLKSIRASDFFCESQDKFLKEKHLLELYKLVEEKGLKAVRLYGPKTHEFLKAYLTERGLI